MWITNGSISDVARLFARTDRGITGFEVESDREESRAGPPDMKVGVRTSAIEPITLENVHLPSENMVG